MIAAIKFGFAVTVPAGWGLLPAGAAVNSQSPDVVKQGCFCREAKRALGPWLPVVCAQVRLGNGVIAWQL